MRRNAKHGDQPSPVKLVCNHLWKIYGNCASMDARAFADPGALRARLHGGESVVAVGDVSFNVHAGEIFVIMGLSGSGKSTVVRCLSRLIEPTHGSVLLDGEELLRASDAELIEIRRHKIGMVFQNFGLLPHLTVLENVAFPLKVQGKREAERAARARTMVDLVGLGGREHAFPHQLSGGQQQRVGIARSLAVEPDLWLLDEPFSALDPLIRRQMQDEFLRLQKMLHKTIVFITHDFLEALRLADRIAIMKDGEFVQVDAPSRIVLSPADDYVRAFTGEVPLVRIITVGDLLQPYEGKLPPRETCDASMSLHEILPFFADHPQGFAVTDGDGVIGQITAAKVLSTLAGAR